MKSSIIQIGENLWVRLLLLLTCSISISLVLRVIVVKLIPMSPLFILAYDGSYSVALVATIIINHFWVEALRAETASSRLKQGIITSINVNESSELLNIPANLFWGWQALGGKLIVTEHKLHFKAHFFNSMWAPKTTDINIIDIVSIQPAKSLWIIPNQLVIKTRKGEQFRFVVNNRDSVIAVIQDLR